MTYTFEELKQLASSFLKRLPTATVDQIENGWKMFAIAYMNTEMTDQQRESEAPALYRIIWREYDTAVTGSVQHSGMALTASKTAT